MEKEREKLIEKDSESSAKKDEKRAKILSVALGIVIAAALVACILYIV